jgi:hypothetical protein
MLIGTDKSVPYQNVLRIEFFRSMFIPWGKA